MHSIQRYEGASTLYGPHTLDAYIERTVASIKYLRSNSSSREHRAKNKYPPDNSGRSISFIIGVLFDRTPWPKNFGDVVNNVANSRYRRGEKVSASFVGANPRNNLRLEQTYAAVEYRPSANSPWQQVRDDSDWGLSFYWRRTSKILGLSEVDIKWEIDAPVGEYRLRYYGDSKSIRGKLSAIEGVSSAFSVV
jgi:neutral ceramidase